MVSRLKTTLIKIVLIGFASNLVIPTFGQDLPTTSSQSWISHPWLIKSAACTAGALIGAGCAYGLRALSNTYKARNKKTASPAKPNKPAHGAHVAKPAKPPVEFRVISNIAALTCALLTSSFLLPLMGFPPKLVAKAQGGIVGLGGGVLLTYLYQQAIERAKTEDTIDALTPVTPHVTLDDYTKDEKVLETLLKDITILTSDDLLQSIKKRGAEPKKGMLLYGPPGSGKTYLVAAIAGSSKIPLLNIKISDIVSKWYGDAERSIAAVFKKAREIARDPQNPKKKCIVFFDEIDALARNRSGNNDLDPNTPRLVSNFIQEIDGLESTNEIIVIGCTNIPDNIDSAMISRLGKPIYIPLPSQWTRIQFIDKKLQDESLHYTYAKATKERTALAIKVADIMDGHDFRSLSDLMQHIIRDSEYYKTKWLDVRQKQDNIDGYVLSKDNVACLGNRVVNDEFILTRAEKYSQRKLPSHVINHTPEYEAKKSAALERLPLDG